MRWKLRAPVRLRMQAALAVSAEVVASGGSAFSLSALQPIALVGSLGVSGDVAISAGSDIADLTAIEWPAVGGTTDYRVKWGTSPATYTNTQSVGTVTSFDLVDLSPTMQQGTTYYLRVYSWNGSTETAVDAEIKLLNGLQIA